MAPDEPPPSPVVRVATINLLRDQGRWPARRRLVTAGLLACRADVIAVQEVVRPRGASSAHDLARDLGGFAVAVAPKVGWLGRSEGIAVLSRWPILAHTVVALGGESRVGQVVELAVGARRLLVGNTHLLVRPWADQTRTRQVERIIAALHAEAHRVAGADPSGRPAASVPLILAGDFNDDPASPALVAARRHLASAHAVAHGGEPEFTCPSPLRSGSRLRDEAVDLALRLAGGRQGPWRATLDYILVSPAVRVLDCTLILDQPDPADATLYPSDHFGLMATVAIAGPPTNAEAQ